MGEFTLEQVLVVPLLQIFTKGCEKPEKNQGNEKKMMMMMMMMMMMFWPFPSLFYCGVNGLKLLWILLNVWVACTLPWVPYRVVDTYK